MNRNILSTIVEHKQREVSARRRRRALADLRQGIGEQPAGRGFIDALQQRAGQRQAAIIAEIKQASPSRGVIRRDFDPAALARGFERAGAACLSVLTDERFFRGADEYLRTAKRHTALPVLRKDFVLEDYQVWETRALGADCLLLIVALLDIAALHELYDLALSLGLDVLVEVHDRQELDRALTLSPRAIGINNRDLKTFAVDLNTTLDLLGHIPKDVLVVTESGIHRRADVTRMLSNGVYGFLVGEALMKQPDPGRALRSLFIDR